MRTSYKLLDGAMNAESKRRKYILTVAVNSRYIIEVWHETTVLL
jgi:hypothetical protein